MAICSIKNCLAVMLCFIAANLPSYSQQPVLQLPVGHSKPIFDASFSPDGSKLLTLSKEGTAKLWETSTGKILHTFRSYNDASMDILSFAKFIPGGNKVATWQITNIETDQIAWDSVYMIDQKNLYNHISPDGKQVISFGHESSSHATSIYDDEQRLVCTFKNSHIPIDAAAFNHTGTEVVTVSEKGDIQFWNAKNGAAIKKIHQPDFKATYVSFSPDDKSLVMINSESVPLILNIQSGKLTTMQSPENLNPEKTMLSFTPNSQWLVQFSNIVSTYVEDCDWYEYYDSVTVWNVNNGRIQFASNGLFVKDENVISPDGKSLVLPYINFSIKKIELQTGKQAFAISDIPDTVNSICIGKDSKTFIAAIHNNAIITYDAVTGKMIQYTVYDHAIPSKLLLTDGDKKLGVFYANGDAILVDLHHTTDITRFTGKAISILDAKFTEDGKNILISTSEGTRNWDIGTGKIDSSNVFFMTPMSYSQGAPVSQEIWSPDRSARMIWVVNIVNIFFEDESKGSIAFSEAEVFKSVRFSPDSKKLILTSTYNTIKIYDLNLQKFIYSFYLVGDNDFLVADDEYHFDGSEAARKLLYFTCGTEIIELEQMKDLLWVPHLADRLMNGETINAKKISELDFCGVTPLVESIGINNNKYQYRITRRRGGLSKVVLSVNGNPTLEFSPEQMTRSGNSYHLEVPYEKLAAYTIAGEMNDISVKAFAADADVTSRGVTLYKDRTKDKFSLPNLYAVMVGVSDYKGDKKDLAYPSKDAEDMATALKNAAEKFLNVDDSQHVFIYKLISTGERYAAPEKRTVQLLLEDIGKKAKPNDILLIFFAGHGVMTKDERDNKQFYFLTSEASDISTSTAVVKDVGISTNELTEWMAPARIKAQKRVLIFDACNSGGFINDLVSVGEEGQGLIAARSDEAAQQIKLLDKLNEKSGLFILAGSASDENSYEFQEFSHGLLTYSMLKAIKERPDILSNGNHLDLSRWFEASKDYVSDLSEKAKKQQEPQIVSTTNFFIGVVDNDVRDQIVLNDQKPMFTGSNLQNADDSIADDDLELNKLVKQEFIKLSTLQNNQIIFSLGNTLTDAYSLSGRYKVSFDLVTANVNLKKGNSINEKFEVSGSLRNLQKLAQDIVEKAVQLVGNK